MGAHFGYADIQHSAVIAVIRVMGVFREIKQSGFCKWSLIGGNYPSEIGSPLSIEGAIRLSSYQKILQGIKFIFDFLEMLWLNVQMVFLGKGR